MSWRDLLYLIRRNLLRMKLRVAMTSIGVLIGTTAVILLVSLGIGLQRFAVQDLGALGELTEIQVFSPSSFGGMGAGIDSRAVLNDRAIDSFADLPGVIVAAPFQFLRVNAATRLNRLEGFTRILGIDQRQVDKLGFEFASGVPRLGKGQAIVGARVAEQFVDPRTRQPPDDPPDLQGQTLQLDITRVTSDNQTQERTVRLRVVGVLEQSGDQDDYTIYLSLDEVLEMNGWASGQRINTNVDGYDQAIVRVEEPRQVNAVEEAITSQGFPAFSAQSVLRSVNQLFLVIQIVLGGIGAVALLVAGFGIANAMIMAIYERTREIGLMKAVGARNRDVMFVFLGEAAAIGALGGLGGAALGLLVGFVANLLARSYLASAALQGGATDVDVPNLVVSPPALLIFSILFATLIGIVSGVYPALRATRLDPIKALRYE